MIDPLALRLRAVAYAFKDFTELPAGSNRGQVIDRFSSFTGYRTEDAVAWCLNYIYYSGYWALYDPVSRKSAWPLKKTGGCAGLAAFARDKGVLVDTPEPMDVGLIWYPKKNRFAHALLVISPNADDTWTSLEGNTSKPGDTNPETQREGWGVFEKTDRRFAPADRFVRWTSLLKK